MDTTDVKLETISNPNNGRNLKSASHISIACCSRFDRVVSVVCFFVLLCSSGGVAGLYAFFYSKLSEVMDVYEAGLNWVFVMLYFSCGMTACASGLGLCLTLLCGSKGPGYKCIAGIHITLYATWVVLMFVGGGLAERMVIRGGPTYITWYKVYKDAACKDLPYLEDLTFDAIFRGFDGDKCMAARTLRSGILYMYIWALWQLAFTTIGGGFGLRSWSTKKASNKVQSF